MSSPYDQFFSSYNYTYKTKIVLWIIVISLNFIKIGTYLPNDIKIQISIVYKLKSKQPIFNTLGHSNINYMFYLILNFKS